MVKKLFQKVKNTLSNKKGSSIIYVIFAVIIVTIITAFLTMDKTSFLFNEIQSIMDSSATTSISYSVDKDKLKKEILAVGKSYISSDGTKKSINQAELNQIIKENYLNQLDKNIGRNNINGVMGYELVNFSTEMTYDNWGVNSKSKKTGIVSAKKRPQIIMDSTVKVKLKSFSDFDTLGNYTMKMYNARKPANDITINVAGRTKDGEIILIVRTVARVVYR